MSATLVSCPACSRQISMAAKGCIHCGHPIKSSGKGMKLLAWTMGLVCLAILGLGLHKHDLLPSPDIFTASTTSLAVPVEKAPLLSDSELALELQAYVLRANRTLPHRPNPMLTLERVLYKPKPHRLTYDYELNVAAQSSGVELENVRPALMRRYCHDETFKLASANGVSVTWRYLDLGRVIHQETIHRCEAGQIASN